MLDSGEKNELSQAVVVVLLLYHANLPGTIGSKDYEYSWDVHLSVKGHILLCCAALCCTIGTVYPEASIFLPSVYRSSSEIYAGSW